MNLEPNFSGCNLFFYLLIITLGRLLSLSVSQFPFFFSNRDNSCNVVIVKIKHYS